MCVCDMPKEGAARLWGLLTAARHRRPSSILGSHSLQREQKENRDHNVAFNPGFGSAGDRYTLEIPLPLPAAQALRSDELDTFL